MTIEDKHHFIIINERGNECQRFYYEKIRNWQKYQTSSDLYSPYPLSIYSFEHDLITLSMPLNIIAVIPKNKNLAYEAKVLSKGRHQLHSIQYFNGNKSELWLIGGGTFHNYYDGSGRFGGKTFGSANSRIVNLE